MKKIFMFLICFSYIFALIPQNVSKAVFQGNIKVIERWLSNGGNINDIDKDNLTLLYIASIRGNLKLVKYLVSKGADINKKVNLFFATFTPLDAAVDKGYMEISKFLISEGAKPSQQTLLEVITNKNLELLKYLYPLVKQKNLDELLRYAIENSNLDIVKYLVSQGANINKLDKTKETPIFTAVRANKLDIVKYLVSKGAKINIENKNGIIPIEIAEQKKYTDIVNYFHSKGYASESDLIYTLQTNNLKNLKKYKNIDINRFVNVGWGNSTLLHLAVNEQNLSIIKYLISRGANVNAKNNFGETPLYSAIEYRNLSIIKYLVSHGADVNVKDKKGRTPIFFLSSLFVTFYGDDLIMKYLVSKGANIHIPDNRNYTPLMASAINGHIKFVKYLVSQGANINYQDNNGNTALHLAIISYHKNKSNINTYGKDNFINIMKFLISKGANINIKNEDGKTPLDLIKEYKIKPIIKYLNSIKGKTCQTQILYNNTLTKQKYTNFSTFNSVKVIKTIKLFTPAYSIAIFHNKEKYIIGGYKYFYIIDANKLNIIKTIKAHKHKINGIVVFNNKIITGSSDSMIKIWDFKGKLIHSLQFGRKNINFVLNIGLVKNKYLLAFAAMDKNYITKLYDLNTLNIIKKYPVFIGYRNNVCNYKNALIINNWNAPLGKENIEVFDFHTLKFKKLYISGIAQCITANKEYIFYAKDKQIFLNNNLFQTTNNNIQSLTIYKNKYLIGGDSKGYLYVWDIKTKNLLKKYKFYNKCINNIKIDKLKNLLLIVGDDKNLKILKFY